MERGKQSSGGGLNSKSSSSTSAAVSTTTMKPDTDIQTVKRRLNYNKTLELPQNTYIQDIMLLSLDGCVRAPTQAT